jgi:hypothetical protein
LAERQLAAAQQELEAAMRERDALVSMSNEVRACMLLSLFKPRNAGVLAVHLQILLVCTLCAPVYV